MTVNIVTKRGWILERCAEEIARAVPGVQVNAGATQRLILTTADAHYYMPAKDMRKHPAPRGWRIGFFTHGPETLPLVPQFDACVAMNHTMGAALVAAGARDVTIIRPGTDLAPRPLTFGVVGRVYNNGRKGADLVAAAVAAGYRFVACGTDRRVAAMARLQWPCPQTHTVADRAAFYRSIDYLVVTSTEEGGPMPVVDALAAGVPVIAPNVGWCWEFPVLRYEVGSWPSLAALLAGLSQPPTWAAWAEGHRALFARLAAREAVPA